MQIELLKMCRKELNLTQEELASEIGISRNYFSELESGKHEATKEVYRKWVRAIFEVA